MLASLSAPDARADQIAIVQQVFFTMTGLELIAAAAEAPCADPIAALLYYSEPSSGAILIECDPALAFTFTSRLMSVSLPDSLNEDVTDAMGELINMIGGNLKGLLPPETQISMPAVVQAEQLSHILATNRRLTRLCLTSDFGRCYVSLLEGYRC